MKNIVHLATEMAPIAKEGGLGDVVFGLNNKLRDLQLQSTVILPFYSHIDTSFCKNLKAFNEKFYIKHKEQSEAFTVCQAALYGNPIFFIDPENNFFKRGKIYGYPDDVERFVFFCKAALAFLLTQQEKGNPTDILHLHDWHTCATTALYKEIFYQRGLQSRKNTPCRLILTVHNFQYQGHCAPNILSQAGLEKNYLIPELMEDNYRKGEINLLKGGILLSDWVTTVSPRHAEEVLTPLGGHGLDQTLQMIQDHFSGITNGLDYNYWNTATDPLIQVHFDHTDKDPIKKKKEAKTALQKYLKLSTSPAPLVGAISRLVPQKGIDLLEAALFRTLEQGGQFVLLGSCPIPEIQERFFALQQRFSSHPNIHLHLTYCEEATHKLFAGADMIVVPSLFEPCGLTQQIALRYGAIPIVRKTGGLMNTIFDIDYDENGNGYVFNDPNNEGLFSALDRALYCWKNNPDKWKTLVKKGLQQDLSWEESAKKYCQIYNCHTASSNKITA